MIEPRRTPPETDFELLLAHVEYSIWATEKTLAMVDRLPEAAVTQKVESSFPSILATLVHVYRGDRYYFALMKGEETKAAPPETYQELKREWANLHGEMTAWARDHLRARKDVVLKGWGVWPCWMALMQMVSHGTHHRGQVVTLLRQAGCTPTPDDFTDLIFYYLQRFPQAEQADWRAVFGMSSGF